MRFAFLGLVLVMLGLACGSVRNPEKFFADKMRATGDITVMGQTGERAESAFARALEAQPEEAGLIFTKSDRQTRTYQVWLTAPTRAAALARLEALLKSFQREFDGQFGRDVWTFTSSWVPPAPTPKALAWRQRIRLVVLGLFAVGAVLMAGGVWMLWVAMKGDKRKVAALLFDNDDPGIQPPPDDDDDDDEPPKPSPPPPQSGGEPETKVI